MPPAWMPWLWVLVLLSCRSTYRDRIGHWLCNLDYVDIRDEVGRFIGSIIGKKAEILGGLD